MTIEHLKKYIFGGKADIVVKNTKTLNHYTFRIVLAKADIKNDHEHRRFYVYHLKEYLGTMVNDTFMPCKDWYDIHLKDGSPALYKKIYVIYNLMVFIFTKNIIPNDIEITHTGRCSRCGRKLKDPKAIEIGMGSYCATL